jgi:5-methylcytosine-specific restriction endonuclease McrA
MEKRCTKCRAIKPADQFYKDAHHSDGLKSCCKACASAAQKVRYEANPESARAKTREWYRANHDRALAYAEQYRKVNTEKVCESTRRWRAKSQDKIKESRRQYYQEHKEQCHVRFRQWYQSHRSEQLARMEAFRKVHPDYFSDWDDRNREKKRGSTNKRRAILRKVTVGEVSREEVFRRDRGICHICGKKLTPQMWHLDHLIPLSKGGSHTPENVAVACPRCNIRRGNHGPAQLRLLG